MTVTWLVNSLSFFAMSAGSLLFFLGLWEQVPPSADNELSPEQKGINAKHRRLLAVGGGALSLWFMMQYLSIIVL